MTKKLTKKISDEDFEEFENTKPNGENILFPAKLARGEDGICKFLMTCPSLVCNRCLMQEIEFYKDFMSEIGRMPVYYSAERKRK
jgi:hypothetical protein